jgi:uncharacterized repeat protein (TIGR04076 family)
VKVKITVLRRMANPDLLERYQHVTAAPCDRFEDGQEFVLSQWRAPPEGFCEWAWEDIHKKLLWVTGEDELAPPPIREGGFIVACCTDGFRPVVFEIRRMVGGEA